MRNRFLLAGQLLLATALGVPAAAQNHLARIDSVFSQYRRSDGPGCLLGARRRNEPSILRAYGMANLEYGIALNPESISESGSVAKQFTSAAVALLATRGKLSLDDDIRKYLPEVPDFGKTITIRNLLTHTSGLRDQWVLLALQGWPPGTQVHSLDQILDLVSRQRRLNFDPGTRYLYSNTGYALAAIIVKRVSGKPLAEFSRDELFLPLGMHHTEWRDDYRRVVPGRAVAYAQENGKWVQDMPFTMVHGNGGLLSSMGDLLTWNDALTAGTIPGGAALVRMMEEPFTLTDGTSTGYGLGLMDESYGGRRGIGHSGATAGYRTYLVRWPDDGLSVAVWCNAANANPIALAQGVADVLLGPPPGAKPPAPPVAVTAADLAPLAGRYRDSTADDVIAFMANGAQLSMGNVAPGLPLTSLGGRRFWSESVGEVRFLAGGREMVRQGREGIRTYQRLQPIDSATVRLADYVGKYRSPELDMTYTVRLKDGRLEWLMNAFQPPTPLSPLYADGFRGGPLSVRFARNGAGKVTGARIFAGRGLQIQVDRIE